MSYIQRIIKEEHERAINIGEMQADKYSKFEKEYDKWKKERKKEKERGKEAKGGQNKRSL